MSEKVFLNFIGDIALFKKFKLDNIDPLKETNIPLADYNIANLEFPISEKNIPFFANVEDKYHVDKEFASKLNLEKIHAYSLANNHIMDYGEEGVESIKDIFNIKGIRNFGYGNSNFNPLVLDLKSIKICIIGFCKIGTCSKKKNGFGPDDYIVEDIINFITINEKKYDHIILFPHWGTELVDIPNKQDIVNAHKFIDAGASAIIGHHPHIIQGTEIYKNRPIYYSIGSFIYLPHEETGYIGFHKKRNFSLIIQLTISKTELKHNVFFYKFNKKCACPVQSYNVKINNYFNKLSKKLNNYSLYIKKKYTILLVREFKAFCSRFLKNPSKTVNHYFKYIRCKKS